MASMRLFHGSAHPVKVPKLELCRPNNDYGRAFYCTEDRDLACEWACPDGKTDGVVNEYLLDTEGLRFLDLDEYSVLHWIGVLLADRPLDKEWNTAEDARRLLVAYALDVSAYDVVAGYRADDSYFAIARAFVSGAISDRTLEKALRLGELGRQVALRTTAALDALTFVGTERVDARVWGKRRMKRDSQARAAFLQMKRDEGAHLRPSEAVPRHGDQGIWIYDIKEDGSDVAR